MSANYKYILTKIHNMFEKEPLYSKMQLDSLVQLLQEEYRLLQDERDRGSTGLSVGRWVQVLEHPRKPFYAKIEKELDDMTVTLEGIYYSDNGVVTQRRFSKAFMLPIPRAIGNMLEYCNDVNIFSEEVLLNGTRTEE